MPSLAKSSNGKMAVCQTYKLTSDTHQATLTSLLLALWCLTSKTLADPKAKAKAKAQLDYYGEYGEYNYADYGDYGPGQYTVVTQSVVADTCGMLISSHTCGSHQAASEHHILSHRRVLNRVECSFIFKMCSFIFK